MNGTALFLLIGTEDRFDHTCRFIKKLSKYGYKKEKGSKQMLNKSWW